MPTAVQSDGTAGTRDSKQLPRASHFSDVSPAPQTSSRGPDEPRGSGGGGAGLPHPHVV